MMKKSSNQTCKKDVFQECLNYIINNLGYSTYDNIIGLKWWKLWYNFIEFHNCNYKVMTRAR